MEIGQIYEKDNTSEEIYRQLLINSVKMRNISARGQRAIEQMWPNEMNRGRVPAGPK